MKICFVGMEIVPMKNDTFVGSVPNNVVRLAKELSIRGHEVTVVTSDINRRLQRMTCFPWGTIHPIHPRGNYASLRSGLQFFLRAIPMILEMHDKENFDVIHGHSAYPLLAPMDGLSSVLGGVPSVFTLYSPIRTVPLRDRRGFYQTLSSTRLSRLFFMRIRSLTVLSENTRESLVGIGIKDDRIQSLPPVVDSTFLSDSDTSDDVKANLGIPEDSPVILYVGNWATWKGVDILIESMAMVKNVFPNVRLVTAWGEPYNWYDERKELIERRIKELGLSETVIQVGIVEDLPNLIRSSELVAAPFLNTDGVADLPMVILESMACGKPVVSTKVGGIPEIVKNGTNGLLVAPGEPEEFASALIRILANEDEANRFGSSARDFVTKNHGPTVVVDKLEDVYISVQDT